MDSVLISLGLSEERKVKREGSLLLCQLLGLRLTLKLDREGEEGRRVSRVRGLQRSWPEQLRTKPALSSAEAQSLALAFPEQL